MLAKRFRDCGFKARISSLIFGHIACLFCATFMGCAQSTPQNEAISLGSVTALQILPTPLPKKPKKEIARICVSYSSFQSHKPYQTLTLENLLKAAQKKTGQTHFERVGVWQQSWHIILWQKKCLILGE